LSPLKNVSCCVGGGGGAASNGGGVGGGAADSSGAAVVASSTAFQRTYSYSRGSRHDIRRGEFVDSIY
jgi:hypothetical protein